VCHPKAVPELLEACRDALGFGSEKSLSRMVELGITLEERLMAVIAKAEPN